MKVLFLYTELSTYFLSCIHEFVKNSNTQVYIFHWPINKEAPFVFSFPATVKVYGKNIFKEGSLIDEAKNISPDLIYCSGWIDKEYLIICNNFRNKIPVILGLDNKWRGTLKQYLASLFRKRVINKYFSHCWIPGKPQLNFAKRLGFKDENISTGFYSCDYNYFHNLYLNTIKQKKKLFPHKFIFTGRYYTFKGIRDLWEAFAELQNETPNNWELWCLGTGDITPLVHPKIKHFGFIQPDKIGKFISDTGVFILPSRFEPWGVAVHEFATAGFPLICSTEVGAAEVFLKDNENGFMFEAGNIFKLKEVLKKTMLKSDVQLLEMGEKSAKLAGQITPGKWSDTLMSIIK